jgi:hypothetical protein
MAKLVQTLSAIPGGLWVFARWPGWQADVPIAAFETPILGFVLSMSTTI